MRKRFFLSIILSSLVCSLHAQINVRVEYNCLKRNSAILAQALIELKGESFVSDLLHQKIDFTVVCLTDSLGTFLELKKLRSRAELPVELKDEISSYLAKNKKIFNICYEKPPGSFSDVEAYQFIIKDLRKNKENLFLLCIGFPAELMTFYSISQKESEEGRYLSRYEYLTSMMVKYLP